MKRSIAVASLLILIAGVGCSQGGVMAPQRSMDASTESAPPPPPNAAPKGSGQSAVMAQEIPAIQRKIIRNGDFSVRVKSYDPFLVALQKQLALTGGYISQTEVNRGSSSIYAASITLRLPPEQLDAFLDWLRTQGIVTSEKLTTDDITEKYYDLKSRLENARRFEARLLEMLKTQTGKLEDVLAVEEKLNQIREQIEQMEGRLRVMDSLVSMSTVTLHVSVEEYYVAPIEPTFGDRASRVWRDSVRALKEFIQGLGLVVIALIPWLIPIAIVLGSIFLILRAIYRFIRRRMEDKGSKTP